MKKKCLTYTIICVKIKKILKERQAHQGLNGEKSMYKLTGKSLEWLGATREIMKSGNLAVLQNMLDTLQAFGCYKDLRIERV